MLKKYFFHQHDNSDCGAACLRMVLQYYGKYFTAATVQKKTAVGVCGTSFWDIKNAAESFYLDTLAIRLSWDGLKEVNKPCIIHWRANHFVVVKKIVKNKFTRKECALIYDPAKGVIKLGKSCFLKNWIIRDGEGYALICTPKDTFFHLKEDENSSLTWKDVFQHLIPFRYSIIGVFVTLTIGGGLSLLSPFLTQAIVDYGIGNKDYSIITLLLFAQMAIALGQLCNDLLRGWLTLKATSLMSIAFIRRFLLKLTSLPISFFDKRNTGDILQRISDNVRIQSFVTNSIISTSISIVFLFVYSGVLYNYGSFLFLIFVTGAFISLVWALLFLKQRRNIDAKRFVNMADTQSNLIELISGMSDIKLNNCEREKVDEWHSIQQELFRTNLQNRSLENIQSFGAVFIDQTKNLIISYLAAGYVINDIVTIGQLFTIQFVLGQLNAPIQRVLSLIKEVQDAQLSMERIGDLYNREDEGMQFKGSIEMIPKSASIHINNLCYKYASSKTPVLRNLNASISSGKITAIVGNSGCGKTTLIKLLVGYYMPQDGEIMIGNHSLKDYSIKSWRDCCGVVTQDGFIFSDSIRKNVTMSSDRIDEEALNVACDIACIRDYIEGLPQKYDTKIGADGLSISSGQKQRLLLARVLYRKPSYLFMDESTNAIDSNTESEIMQKLFLYFKECSIVIVAHRLSTVLNADNILVMDNGRIVEEGNHLSLIANGGTYSRLIHNQCIV